MHPIEHEAVFEFHISRYISNLCLDIGLTSREWYGFIRLAVPMLTSVKYLQRLLRVY